MKTNITIFLIGIACIFVCIGAEVKLENIYSSLACDIQKLTVDDVQYIIVRTIKGVAITPHVPKPPVTNWIGCITNYLAPPNFTVTDFGLWGLIITNEYIYTNELNVKFREDSYRRYLDERQKILEDLRALNAIIIERRNKDAMSHAIDEAFRKATKLP